MSATALKTAREQQKPGLKKIQAKLQVNEPGDVYEQEADAMANRVMQMQPNSSLAAQPVTGLIGQSVQRKCAHCEEEEKKLRRKESGGAGGTTVSADFSASLQASKGSGTSLPAATRGFMEHALSADFSDVKIHTGSQATEMNRDVNAKAFTYGNDIYFNAGEYSTNTSQGQHLLAHELTHVVQQTGAQQPAPAIQRAIGSHTSCAANSNNSPANPIDVFEKANNRAVLMALGASHLLFVDSLFMQDSNFGSSGILNMYRGRFGDPAQVTVAGHTKFRNRWNSSLHNTLLLAQASEMQHLSNRSRQISEFLDGAIHFKCTGTSHTTIGSCTHHCNAGNALASCPAGHGREIAVCPDFWNGFGSIDQKAIGMIHEVLHMLFHFTADFDSTPASTTAQRRIEPECYASLVADIYGVSPVDPSCPII